MGFSPKLTVVVCIERGTLEKYAILLVRSLKKFGGFLSDSDLVLYNPRSYFRIGFDARQILKNEGVILVDQSLNKRYKYYDLANKVIACAHAEENYKADYYLFLDTDTIILNAPEEIIPTEGYQLSLKPVHVKGVGTTGKDNNSDYWHTLFKFFGIDKCGQYVISSLDHCKIWGYWNSGVICSTSNFGLFREWKANFEKMISSNLLPGHSLFFTEQVSLAITIHKFGLNVMELPLKLNYPLNFHDKLEEGKRIENINEISILHHHGQLNEKTIMNLGELVGDERKKEWVVQNLEELNIYPKMPGHKILSDVQNIEKRVYKLLNYWTRDF